MFQCSKLEKIIFSISMIFLCCFLSFHISKYSNDMQISIFGSEEIPEFYTLFMGISSLAITTTPLLFFLFIFITTDLMMNYFFELKYKREDIISSAGLSLIPLLISLYFSWYNLTNFVSYAIINSGKTIKDITYSFGFSYRDIEDINLIMRIMMYVVFTLTLMLQVRNNYSKIVISSTLPTILVILFYAIIK